MDFFYPLTMLFLQLTAPCPNFFLWLIEMKKKVKVLCLFEVLLKITWCPFPINCGCSAQTNFFWECHRKPLGNFFGWKNSFFSRLKNSDLNAIFQKIIWIYWVKQNRILQRNNGKMTKNEILLPREHCNSFNLLRTTPCHELFTVIFRVGEKTSD